ncbi:MAG: STAS domain-containing protein [Leptospira sp.]|jgi:anti-anti-sigma factor|nr:STAS domain-containing protein [Leptospira sp.]
MFEFHITKNGEEATIEFIGNLSVKDSSKIKSELIQLKEAGIKRLTFDFGKLAYLDSSGIGVLLHAYNWTKEKQGTIRIINMSPEVKTIFMISNLIDAFNVQ